MTKPFSKCTYVLSGIIIASALAAYYWYWNGSNLITVTALISSADDSDLLCGHPATELTAPEDNEEVFFVGCGGFF